MMNLVERIGREILYFDGGSGTMLQKMGLMPGELPENWNLSYPDRIRKLHREYLRAGADFVLTNTFGVNALKFDDPETIIRAAFANAFAAREDCADMGKTQYVAFDLGPIGRMLRPLGDLDFEDAVAMFARNVHCAAECGADVILIETMNDLYEAKAAVLAAKENCDLPVFLTTVYDESCHLLTGADPEAVAAMAEGLGVDALGVNCSLGPRQMAEGVVPRLAKCVHVPLIVNPNAGLPRSENGATVFDVGADEFSDVMVEIVKQGATIVGGCCGTTPEYIRKTVEKTRGLTPCMPNNPRVPVIGSYTHAVTIGQAPVLIGERVNPTGKKRMKEALRSGDISYLLSEAVRQQDEGAHVLDVNVGLPEIDECEVLTRAMEEIQAVCDLPLQLDTSDPKAMGRAMRRYNGKPLVNSVNGKREIMEKIFPLVKKYGGVVIALTLDESGIPETAEGRLAIAERIKNTAAEYGIDPSDIVVDPLAMAVSADAKSAKTTLRSIELIREKLGLRTSLGVSNISFGLPQRPVINAAFFAMALERGLDCAIMNPFSREMMQTYYAFCALRGIDRDCRAYLEFAAKGQDDAPKAKAAADMTLKDAIENGMAQKSGELAATLLETQAPLAIIDSQIVPALDEVGRGFEQKRVFLPQLLMSAEAANAAFESVKRAIPQGGGSQGKIVIATVQGDIHDIGKNIVRVLLQNYGFDVLDLGRDVPPEEVCRAARESGAKLVGLSALMTTTVPAMAETIRLLKEEKVDARVVVGGAVLTQEYADAIGADFYAKDAMQTVRCAQEVFG